MGINPSFIENKRMRPIDGSEPAWCEVYEARFGLTRQVLRTYKNDPTERYARVMVKAWSPMTGGEQWADIGDEYWVNVFEGELVKVLGEDPTPEQLEEWAELRAAANTPTVRWL